MLNKNKLNKNCFPIKPDNININSFYRICSFIKKDTKKTIVDCNSTIKDIELELGVKFNGFLGQKDDVTDLCFWDKNKKKTIIFNIEYPPIKKII